MSTTLQTSHHAANATYAYVGSFIDELQRSGVHNVVICPGSRSTPLALSFASHPTIRVWMHIDERSAAFFGLGMARRLRQPVALVCTSGTAAANFLPAIVEAHLTHTPLLVLTADRPHELRENGAPQAIDQNRLYGSHAKWFVDVALPEASNTALRYIRTLACRATALSLAAPAGPVHLNFPFREPLTPGPLVDQPLPDPARRDPLAWQGRANNAPYITVDDAIPTGLPPGAIRLVAAQLRCSPRGLIVVGPLDHPALTQPLIQLARLLGYPILADPLSQLRSGTHPQEHILCSYDAFLRLETVLQRAEPQIVLRFGAMPTAKPLLLYLQRYASCPQIVVDGNEGWEEPSLLASQLIHIDPAGLCEQLLPELNQAHALLGDPAWLTNWQRYDLITRTTLHTMLQDIQPFFEGRVFTELADILPEHTTLFAGNSMPVRDLDTFFWGGQKSLYIQGNRGANGIDGVVSSALGASTAGKPTLLVIGDLSFLHDQNGLLAARLHRLHLTVVLINNDGGGIFSFLPQASYPEHFEQVFGTPTGLDFQPIVEMYGGTFQRPTNWHTFRSAVTHGLNTEGLHVIEVKTDRSTNVTLHRQLWQALDQALKNQLDDEG